MQRREVLGILGSVAALTGLSPEQLRAAAIKRVPSAPFFTGTESAILDRLADLIIPATDTPGALEAGATRFIEVIVSEWYTSEDAERFRRGLADLDTRASAHAAGSFVEASEAQQIAILTGLEAEGRALRERDRDAPTPFFQRLRGLVLSGYYSSEIGMLQELRWHVIPGRFEGCVPLAVARDEGGAE